MTSANDGDRELLAVVLNVRRRLMDTGRVLELRARRRGNIVWFRCIEFYEWCCRRIITEPDSSEKL